MPDFNIKDPSFFTQQVMLIGTYDPDGKERFAPISWVSYSWGPPPCLVVSIWGVKRTKENIARTGMFSATVLTPDMLPFAEQFNRGTYKKDLSDKLEYATHNGNEIDVPLLSETSYSFECTVLRTTEIGKTITYFGKIVHVNMSDEIKAMDFFDLQKINPVVYSSDNYFAIGDHLGKIGDFSK